MYEQKYFKFCVCKLCPLFFGPDSRDCGIQISSTRLAAFFKNDFYVNLGYTARSYTESDGIGFTIPSVTFFIFSLKIVTLKKMFFSNYF